MSKSCPGHDAPPLFFWLTQGHEKMTESAGTTGYFFPNHEILLMQNLEPRTPPGAHDSDSTWPRAREKRETKRTTRDREEQLEVRGAFCFPFLARARAYSVGTGAPACTDRPPPGGVPPLPRPPTLAPGATFGAAAVPRGSTSRELTVPSKGCRPQKKNYSDTLLCSIFATTLPFGQKIFFVQKCNIWRQLARCQRLCPRSGQNWGNAPPPRNHQNVTCWVRFSGMGGANAAAAATNRARIAGRVVPYARRRSN